MAAKFNSFPLKDYQYKTLTSIGAEVSECIKDLTALTTAIDKLLPQLKTVKAKIAGHQAYSTHVGNAIRAVSTTIHVGMTALIVQHRRKPLKDKSLQSSNALAT